MEKRDGRFRLNGRRGRYLLGKSVLYLFFGLGYVVPTALTPGAERSVDYLLQFGIPTAVLGIPWLLVSLLVGLGAFLTPPRKDGWAFTLLVVMALLWSAVYFASWIYGPADRSWLLGGMLAAFAFASYTVSGMVPASEVKRWQDEVVKLQLLLSIREKEDS